MGRILLILVVLGTAACNDSHAESEDVKITEAQTSSVTNKTQAEIDKEKDDKRWEELNKHGFSREGVMKDAKPFTKSSQGLDY